MARIVITVEDAELLAISQSAQKERRPTRDQAAILIREALIARGLLATPIFPVSESPIVIQGARP